MQLVNDSTGQVLRTSVNGEATAPVQITGAANKAEQLTVELHLRRDVFVPLGLSFVPGASTPPDVLIVRGPNAADTFNLTSATLTANSQIINYSGVQQIQLKGGTSNT